MLNQNQNCSLNSLSRQAELEALIASLQTKAGAIENNINVLNAKMLLKHEEIAKLEQEGLDLSNLSQQTGADMIADNSQELISKSEKIRLILERIARSKQQNKQVKTSEDNNKRLS